VNVPTSQSGHTKAPTLELAVPGSQDWHVLAPLDAWNVPGEQLAHVVWPGESVNVPGLQDWHVVAPPDAWNVPGGQVCAVAGVAIAPVRVRTTSAVNAWSGDRRAIDFPFPSVRDRLATRRTTR
jgi:hypothetical protein